MHYTVVSKGNHSTFGDFFYYLPFPQECYRLYKDIAKKCWKNLEETYKGNSIAMHKARERLKQELKWMKQTECAFEFLLVEAIVAYSKKEGYPIMVMGSLSGSMIAYLLGISSFDPLDPRYDISIAMVWKMKDGRKICKTTLSVKKAIIKKLNS